MSQIFLSYAREDVAIAKLVKTGLEARGYTVTLDIDDFGRGDWAAQIEARIRQALDVVVLVGPHSLASEHVGAEVSQGAGLAKPLVPVLLGEPPAEVPAWAQTLLRNQAARYDALDLQVSLDRIERLLACRRTGRAGGGRRWPLLAGAALTVAVLAGLGLRQLGWPDGLRGGGAAPVPTAASAASTPTAAVPAGRARISFKGAISRALIEDLEAKLRAAGYEVPRSQRDEAVADNALRYAAAVDETSAQRLLVTTQLHFAERGCRLVSAWRAQPGLPGAGAAAGDIAISVNGSCP